MARRRYWETSTVIALLKEEEGRVDTCRDVFARAEDGEFWIVTSAFTLAEVLWPKGQPEVRAAMQEIRQTVRDFFRRKPIVLTEVTRQVAELAQEVVWEHGVRPKDAIHVASALKADVEALETYDEGLLSLDGQVRGLAIRLPFLEPEPEPLAPPSQQALEFGEGDPPEG